MGGGLLPHLCAEFLADEGLRRHRSRGARQDEHALWLLLVILAGSAGREAGSHDARLDYDTGGSAGADQSDALRHLRRDGIFERHPPVHHRQRRGDPERAWRHQHPDLRAGRRGAAADCGRPYLRPSSRSASLASGCSQCLCWRVPAPTLLARRLAGRSASTESRSTPRCHRPIIRGEPLTHHSTPTRSSLCGSRRNRNRLAFGPLDRVPVAKAR